MLFQGFIGVPGNVGEDGDHGAVVSCINFFFGRKDYLFREHS